MNKRLATREQNEHDFPNWITLPNGGRRYWVDKAGRVRGFARYAKEKLTGRADCYPLIEFN